MAVPLVGKVGTVLYAMNDAAGGKEEQPLEEGMREQVEERRRVRANTNCRHHETKLANGGVGQNALDVPLRHGNRCRKERRKCPCEGHIGHCTGRNLTGGIEDREHAHKQEDTGRDHGGRVNHGANGRGAFHGVGQPHMQRELRALADGAKEDQHSNQRNRGYVGIDQRQGHVHHRQMLHVCRLEDIAKLQTGRVAPRIEQHHANEHDCIAHTRGHKGLDACLARALLLVPEANQQVRA